MINLLYIYLIGKCNNQGLENDTDSNDLLDTNSKEKSKFQFNLPLKFPFLFWLLFLIYFFLAGGWNAFLHIVRLILFR